MSLWVFGYGSLMWDPGFDPAESALGALHGYARSFCMWSIHHRGTQADPGLVLALDEDAAAHCKGIALRVRPEQEPEVLAMLRERELVSSAYLEKTVELRLSDGRTVQSIAYVMDETHEQYCGGMSLNKQAQVIAHAVGGRGPNTEYLYNTAQHLAQLGIEDLELTELAASVRKIAASA